MKRRMMAGRCCCDNCDPQAWYKATSGAYFCVDKLGTSPPMEPYPRGIQVADMTVAAMDVVYGSLTGTTSVSCEDTQTLSFPSRLIYADRITSQQNATFSRYNGISNSCVDVTNDFPGPVTTLLSYDPRPKAHEPPSTVDDYVFLQMYYSIGGSAVFYHSGPIVQHKTNACGELGVDVGNIDGTHVMTLWQYPDPDTAVTNAANYYTAPDGSTVTFFTDGGLRKMQVVPVSTFNATVTITIA